MSTHRRKAVSKCRLRNNRSDTLSCRLLYVNPKLLIEFDRLFLALPMLQSECQYYDMD